MATIYTYGFLGHTIDDFIEKIKSHHVQVVIDVRERPLSKEDHNFNKFALVDRLYRENTKYRHMKILGCTENMRNLQKEELGYLKYFRYYERHLQQHREIIRDLGYEIKNTNICLLCEEPNPATCHRTLIGDYLQIENYNNPIEHLS